MSSPSPETPVPASNGAAPELAGAPKVLVKGISGRISLKQLIDDAAERGVDARFFFGKPSFRRNLYIVAKNLAEKTKAQEFVLEWYRENQPPKKQKSPKAATPVNEESKDGETPAEASASEAKPEAEAEEKPKEEQQSKPEPRLKFIDLLDSTRKNRRRGSKKTSGSEGSKPEGEQQPEQQNNGEATESSGKKQKKRASKKQKAARAGAENSTETSNDPTSEPNPESTSSNEASPNNEAGKPKQTKNKKNQTPRPRIKVVPQPGRVAVRLPAEATVEELRALLPDFDSVEISLKHLPSRKIQKGGRKARRSVTLPEYTLALIDVREEDQQKAIEVLTGKEVRGSTLNPQAGRSRVREETPADAAEPLEEDQNKADTQVQPQVEHVETQE